jgi:hypothetical protein
VHRVFRPIQINLNPVLNGYRGNHLGLLYVQHRGMRIHEYLYKFLRINSLKLVLIIDYSLPYRLCET